MKTVFEKSQKGQHAYSIPKEDPEFSEFLPPEKFLRSEPVSLPEISELDLTRHFAQLASRNVGIDNLFYPLGSCTMKLNPRVNELAASLPGFTRTHPLAPAEMVQGNLQIIHELIRELCHICGMNDGTLAPNAGAQGEFVGVRMIAKYHEKNGESNRREMLIPDSAHGTNPATAAMAGMKTIPIRMNERGDIDLEDLRSKVSENTAGMMLTNPNTLGLFSPTIHEITEIVHEAGGLMYCDGANLNAMLEMTRPGDMGFDVMHINLHKTFSTPHGGGGPGSGPVVCKESLAPFLPVPRVIQEKESYRMDCRFPDTIGAIATFHGNFGIYLRAYLYIKLHGRYGLRRISEIAVLNANYLKTKLAKLFTVPFSQPCMHEFVLQADNYVGKGAKAGDIAKRILDYGFYAPTIYFPLIIKECMLIEPTESESKATLDRFVQAMESIVIEIEGGSDVIQTAPHDQPVTRLDEVLAAKSPVLKHILDAD